MQSMPQSRSRIEIELPSGEIFWALSGTLASLEADLNVRTRPYGDPFNTTLRGVFSLSPERLIEIRNNTESNRHILLTPPFGETGNRAVVLSEDSGSTDDNTHFVIEGNPDCGVLTLQIPPGGTIYGDYRLP